MVFRTSTKAPGRFQGTFGLADAAVSLRQPEGNPAGDLCAEVVDGESAPGQHVTDLHGDCVGHLFLRKVCPWLEGMQSRPGRAVLNPAPADRLEQPADTADDSGVGILVSNSS